MDSVRTSSLFHYTDYQSLLKIIQEGLIPNYCKESLIYADENPDQTDLVIGIPMVSFCDIPISRIGELSGRYGKFAIGLKKNWAKGKAINPVSYAKDNRVLLAYISALSMQRIAQKKISEMFDRSVYNLVDVILQPSKSEDIKYPLIASTFLNEKKNEVTRNIGFLLGFAKRYSGYRKDSDREKGISPQDNYVENEWRYIVPECPKCKWFWSKDDYEQWKGVKKPSPTEYLVSQKLGFTIDDISFIIVKTEKQVTHFVSQFSNIKKVGGNKIEDLVKKNVKTPQDLKKQLENLRRQLASKIISLERIKNDF